MALAKQFVGRLAKAKRLVPAHLNENFTKADFDSFPLSRGSSGFLMTGYTKNGAITNEPAIKVRRVRRPRKKQQNNPQSQPKSQETADNQPQVIELKELPPPQEVPKSTPKTTVTRTDNAPPPQPTPPAGEAPQAPPPSAGSTSTGNGSAGGTSGGGSTQQLQSGGSTDNLFQTALSKIEKGRANDMMKERLLNQKRNLDVDIQGAKGDEEKLSQIFKDNEIEGYQQGMTKEARDKLIDAHFSSQVENGPGISDYFYGYHGPGLTFAGATGASVLAMSSSKGQVSNSQLYSDPFR